MGNYPLDDKLIIEEASWFDRSDEGVVHGEFTETWTPPKYYCYRCGDSLSSAKRYIHPDICQGRPGYYHSDTRHICHDCYVLAQEHEKFCTCVDSEHKR